jgi:fructose-1,6-bisphosphatase/inositol monophosphatase family enzyme
MSRTTGLDEDEQPEPMSIEFYRPALNCAIEAADGAARMLLLECARPGGPRGDLGHCPADDEAEVAIKRVLLGAFPAFGFLGEETDHVKAAPGETHIWVVDPNDGTRSMQQGYRGHAVSIALVRSGVPVLGVVHAVDAPDDEGDRFAWAEGCGPLTRNGQVVAAGTWPESLTSTDIVLVSQSANLHPLGNLACVAPGRFLNVPSIAYRLALVAAGEGVVGVSLNGPCAWDFAGGHALLRGAGGVLVNQDGREITFDDNGWTETQFVFGGGPTMVRDLAKRRWRSARGSGFRAAAPLDDYGPAHLQAG